MKTGFYYGIDFGTTNTSVYLYNYVDGIGVKEQRYGTDGKENQPYSSCIAIPYDSSKEVIYGRSVKENINSLADNYRIIKSFKSLLGTEEEIVVGGTRYNGTKLVAMFLNHVRSTVNHDDFNEAIFSIPVDFSSEARKDLVRAAESIGIKVKGFVSESSSAYISKMQDIKAYSKVLVIDWGGGTLDLSILKLKDKKIYEEAVYGVKYGGDDIDNELALRIHPKVYPGISFDELEPSKKDKLIKNVEQMKIHFSEDDDDYEMLLGPGSKLYNVEYEEFAEIITPLVNENVIKSILDIMAKAKTAPESLDAVILAGGSSGIRVFAEIIKMLFGNDKIIFDTSYQWMVARGAALTSAIDCKFKLSDDVCLLLSDDSAYPLLRKDINGVGDSSEEITFSLTDDSTDAHFIFTDSTGKNKYGSVSVQTKGYYNEKLVLSALIDTDQIAKIKIGSSMISDTYCANCELNKLRFYYDMSEIEE